MDKDITDGHGWQTQTHLNGHQPALAHDYIDDLFPLNNIPPELMALPQWVAVKLVPRDDGTDKYDKPPYNPYRPAYGASTTDPTTWASYHLATAVVARYDYDGPGFVLTPPM